MDPNQCYHLVPNPLSQQLRPCNPLLPISEKWSNWILNYQLKEVPIVLSISNGWYYRHVEVPKDLCQSIFDKHPARTIHFLKCVPPKIFFERFIYVNVWFRLGSHDIKVIYLNFQFYFEKTPVGTSNAEFSKEPKETIQLTILSIYGIVVVLFI